MFSEGCHWTMVSVTMVSLVVSVTMYLVLLEMTSWTLTRSLVPGVKCYLLRD